ncbi:MAG: hypothetical protein AB7S78_00080 [Candidatus Omnitrophota bacterium]
MTLFDLKNNPLFLQGWRERNRFSAVTSAVTLISIIVIILFVSAFLNETYVYNYIPQGNSYKTERILLPWARKFLLDLSILQGIVLFLFGCVNAYKMAARERTSGTVDFHRSSPTPRRNQIAGLVLGSTSLEWWVFIGIFFIELILTLLMDIPLWAVLQFNLQLAVCGLFYQTIFSLIGISRHPLKNKAGPFVILIGVYILGQLLIYNKMSFFNQLTWLPAYSLFDLVIKGVENPDYGGYYQRHSRELLYMLFGTKLNPLLFQLMVQIPFTALCLVGIGRRFSNLDQPVFSKPQTLLATFYTFILFTGSFVSILLMGQDGYYSTAHHVGFLLYFILTFGIGGAILATPNYLSFIRGLRRAKKLNLSKINSADNSSSNGMWLVVFCFIATVTLSFFYIYFKIQTLSAVMATATVLSYVIFFASFLEFYQLSRYHNKKGIAWTIIIIFWVLIPVFGLVTKKIIQDSVVYKFLLAPSPFFGGLEPVIRIMNPSRHSYTNPEMSLGISLSVAGGMAVIAAVLAYLQRQKLKNQA